MRLTIPTLLTLATTTHLITAIPDSDCGDYPCPEKPLADIRVYKSNECGGDSHDLVDFGRVTVTSECQKLEMPSNAKDYVVSVNFHSRQEGGGQGSATLFTDENCKNPGLPKPVRAVAYPEFVCMHPSDFKGEVWGSIMRTK